MARAAKAARISFGEGMEGGARGKDGQEAREAGNEGKMRTSDGLSPPLIFLRRQRDYTSEIGSIARTLLHPMK